MYLLIDFYLNNGSFFDEDNLWNYFFFIFNVYYFWNQALNN